MSKSYGQPGDQPRPKPAVYVYGDMDEIDRLLKQIDAQKQELKTLLDEKKTLKIVFSYLTN